MDQTAALLTDDSGPPQRFRAEVKEGPDQGKWIRVDRAVLLGSSPLSDLPLTDRAISRRHCTLEPRGRRVRLRDEGSKNGVWLGGVRVTEVEIPPGAEIRLGDSVIQVDIDRFPAQQTAAVPIDRFGRFLGKAPALAPMYALLESVARSDLTVLLEGESGTGKELLAEALHESGARAGGPFIVVDFGAMPETLIESELFGHEKGAFTGADQTRAGAFSEAEGGTIFLDEIGELPIQLQSRLLGVLERRQFRRVGGSKPISVDVRVIAATNRNLELEVEEGRFRLDLFHRLAVALVRVPPLRERIEDVDLLVEHFVAGIMPSTERRTLPPEVIHGLKRQNWPGNIRELRNHVERMLLIQNQPLSDSVVPSETAFAAKAQALLGLPYSRARATIVDEFTDLYVADMLGRHGGNVSKAAEAAGVARRHFHRLKRR